MPLVTIITTDVAARFRGFLASVALEVSPCVFVSPRMSKAVRERIWETVTDWHAYEPRGSVVMVWRDRHETGGVGIAQLGTPRRQLVEVDGMWLTRREK